MVPPYGRLRNGADAGLRGQRRRSCEWRWVAANERAGMAASRGGLSEAKRRADDGDGSGERGWWVAGWHWVCERAGESTWPP
jgi:hypothetical protein